MDLELVVPEKIRIPHQLNRHSNNDVKLLPARLSSIGIFSPSQKTDRFSGRLFAVIVIDSAMTGAAPFEMVGVTHNLATIMQARTPFSFVISKALETFPF